MKPKSTGSNYRAITNGKFTKCGHVASEENTYLKSGTGYKVCKECNRENSRKVAAKNAKKRFMREAMI